MAQTRSSPYLPAARYSAAHSGDAVLVFRHDSLILEQYQNGWTSEKPHPLASGTKTFACGSADGLLQLDGLVVAQMGSEMAQMDPEMMLVLSGVTVRQLLNLTSGLSVDQNGRLTRGFPPGQHFAYGGASFSVFYQLLASKLPDGDVVSYLKRRIFTPLGITNFTMQPGNLASGASMTARDWGRFGLLLLNRGRAGNKQLIPNAALAECVTGSDANPFYGLGVWLNPAEPLAPSAKGVTRAGKEDRTISVPDLPHDLYMAAGSGGQRLYILPTQGLVVVRFGHNTGPDYRDDVFLRLLLAR